MCVCVCVYIYINTVRDSNVFNDTMLPMCSNQDKVLNAFGNRLLHLCKETCLCIINGRCGDDKNLGKFTCYNYNGSSVVDYLLTSYDNFDSISSFSVGDLTEFSKHVPITFNVNHGLDIELRNINSSHKYITWSCDKKEEYTHTLENHLIQLRNIVNQTNSTDCEIDSVIKGFTDVLYDASFSVGKSLSVKVKKIYA